jgi:hypothetical protein
MAVMMPREKWTDERLDDLNKKVDDGFARLDRDVKDLGREINARFDAQNRNLIGGLFVLIATVIGSNAF